MSDPVSTPLIPGLSDPILLGRGGFGAVYRAFDPALERDVAIKVLHTPREATAILREARVAATLAGHPNILPIHSAGVLEDGSAYLVMDFAPRGSLQDRLGRLTVAEVIRVGVRLAGALNSLHELGIVHRDVKPANILFSEFDEPMLTDFGLAAPAVELGPGRRSMTLAFAPPEAFLGARISPAADVYALSLTLAVAFTGRNPQQELLKDGTAKGIGAIVSQGLIAAFDQDERVPPPARHALNRGLELDPAVRPTAKELGLSLQGAAVALGIERPEMILLEPSRRTALSMNRHGPVEDFRDIIEQPTAASDATMYRAALRVEDRMRGRGWSNWTLALLVASLASALPAFLARPTPFGTFMRLLLVVAAVGIAAGFLGWISLSLTITVRRKRASSLSKQALEMSARLRNVYLNELRIVRARESATTALTFSEERL